MNQAYYYKIINVKFEAREIKREIKYICRGKLP